MDRVDTQDEAAVLVPESHAHVDEVADQCRELVKNRALLAASIVFLPIPGLGFLTDVSMLARLLPRINEAFGLTPEQVAKLAPDRQLVIYKLISAGGGMFIGKLVTQQLIVRALRAAGLRMSARQLWAFIPIAGHAVSAGITYGVMRWICEQHIRQCVAVCRQLIEHPQEAARKLDDRYNPPLGV